MAWRSANDLTGSMGLTPSNHGVIKLFNAGLDDYSIYAVDLPGHGKSDGKSKSTIEEYSIDIMDFLDAMELENVCLVGHSMGAAIALNASLSQHWRIRSVVAIGGARKIMGKDSILEGLQNTFEATVDDIVKYSWHNQTGAIADSQQMASYFREKAKQRILNAGSRTVHGDFLACSRFDLDKRLVEISVPVLVIASDCDRMVPLHVSQEMAEKLPETLVIHGDGRNVELLIEENIEKMDAFLGVTNDSETNIMSCLMAKSKNIGRTIAIVDNTDYFELSESIGVDTLINKKLLAANEIFRFIRKGNILELNKLNNMNAEVLEFLVNKDSKVKGKKIRDLDFPRSAIIGGIIRGGIGKIALGDFTIKKGDRILVCSLYNSINKVEKLFL